MQSSVDVEINMSRLSVTRPSSDADEDPNVKTDQGRFTFSNGDTFSGGYMIVKDIRSIMRQDGEYVNAFKKSTGHGTYVTGDFNKYETFWVEDQIVGEVYISHNNGTEYKGTLCASGKMFGRGDYTFTDNSMLGAVWDNNVPVADITLREPAGYTWKGVSDGKEVVFTAGNHFWDEINPPIDLVEDEEEEDEEHFDVAIGSKGAEF